MSQSADMTVIILCSSVHFIVQARFLYNFPQDARPLLWIGLLTKSTVT